MRFQPEQGWLQQLYETCDAQDRMVEVQTALNRAKLPFGARKAHPMRLDTYEFKMDKKDYNVYWDVRKGLIPIVGGARETGDAEVP
jgi:D-lactate dehydrogenase